MADKKVEKPKKLEASKEAAKKALEAFEGVLDQSEGAGGDDANYVKAFLTMVIKNLPTEKYIAAEKQRLKDEKKAAKAK